MEVEENQPEENGFSNRHVSTTFIPPLTLGMTYAGARGDTAAQMAQTLHCGTNQNRFAALFGELEKQLNGEQEKKGMELNIANGLWGQEKHPFLPSFLKVAKQSYEANLKQVDFRTESESARRQINDWVSNKTKDKITNLIQPGVLTPATRMVLVNAIYFKGRWASEFEKHNTIKAAFTVSPAQKVEVPLMSRKTDFKYAEVEGLQLLELPYAGDEVDMVNHCFSTTRLFVSSRAIATWHGS